MQTHVTTTILDDSISGDAIDGGDISNLNSLQCAILLISGDASSIILNTTIGSSTLAECASIYGNTIRAFSSLSMLSSTGAALFEVFESGALSVRANYYDGVTNFAKISKAYIELSPTSLRLMTSSAAPAGFQVRAAQNWYFSDATTASLYTLVVRGNSTIPTGTLGGTDIATMATRHLLMYAWYSGFDSTARNYLASLSAVTAASLANINGIGGLIATANWDYVRNLDQNLTTSTGVAFGSVLTGGNIMAGTDIYAVEGVKSGDNGDPVMWKIVWDTVGDTGGGLGRIELDSNNDIISIDTFLGFTIGINFGGPVDAFVAPGDSANVYSAAFEVISGVPYIYVNKTAMVWTGIAARILVYYKAGSTPTTTVGP